MRSKPMLDRHSGEKSIVVLIATFSSEQHGYENGTPPWAPARPHHGRLAAVEIGRSASRSRPGIRRPAHRGAGALTVRRRGGEDDRPGRGNIGSPRPRADGREPREIPAEMVDARQMMGARTARSFGSGLGRRLRLAPPARRRRRCSGPYVPAPGRAMPSKTWEDPRPYLLGRRAHPLPLRPVSRAVAVARPGLAVSRPQPTILLIEPYCARWKGKLFDSHRHVLRLSNMEIECRGQALRL